MSTFTLGPALLFCPADRPERYAKALERADGVILDLEDAVAPAAKRAARGALIETDLDPERVIVRVNPLETDEIAADLATLSQTDYRRIMVPKAESAKRIRRFDSRFEVIALLETAKGVAHAERIAELRNVTALMWGAEDLVASLGGTSSRSGDGTYRDVARHARSTVLLAAGAYGKATIDAVHIEIDDTAGLEAEARDAAAVGFAATAVIHPSQVAIVREAYRPTDDELDWARGVVEGAAANGGVFRLDGRMVDGPVVRHAERVLARGRSTME